MAPHPMGFPLWKRVPTLVCAMIHDGCPHPRTHRNPIHRESQELPFVEKTGDAKLFWSAANKGFGHIRGYLRKMALFLRCLDFPGAARALRKRAPKKAEKGRKMPIWPISRKGGQTPLKPPFVTLLFEATRTIDQSALKVTDLRWQREPKTQIFTENSPLLLEIPAFGGRRKPQQTADFRRKPKIFAENCRNRSLGSVTLGPSPLARPDPQIDMAIEDPCQHKLRFCRLMIGLGCSSSRRWTPAKQQHCGSDWPSQQRENRIGSKK